MAKEYFIAHKREIIREIFTRVFELLGVVRVVWW